MQWPFAAESAPVIVCIVTADQQDLLLNVVASAFYYNAGLAMGALRQAGAVQHAFAAWLGGINADGKHFRRLYDKKARRRRLPSCTFLPVCCVICRSCLVAAHANASNAAVHADMRPQMEDAECYVQVQVLGLLAVLALPDAELPPEVAAGAHDILAAIIKLLSAYREQQVRTLVRKSRVLALQPVASRAVIAESLAA
jgi:hypothetical protein